MQQQAQEFNKLRYAQFMCNELGIATTYIKDADIEALADAPSINKYLLGVTQQVQASTDHVLSPEDQALLNSKVTLDSSPQVQQQKQIETDNLTRIRNVYRDVDQYLVAIRNARMKLQEILRTPTRDIASVVADVQKTTGFKYNAKLSRDCNDVVFTYDKFTLRHIDAVQKIDMQVDLGPFDIYWEPVAGSIQVYNQDGALNVEGYPHPHIETGGHVCWGNGQEAMQQAVKVQDIKTALIILDRIFKTYNPDSPYIQLHRFAEKLNPLAAYGPEYTMQRYGTQWAWIRLYNSNAHTELYNIRSKLDLVVPAGNRLTPSIGSASYEAGCVPLYRVLHKDTKARASGSPYFTMIGNRYYKLRDEHIYGHETIEDVTKHPHYKGVPF